MRASEQKEAERAAWRKTASSLSSRDLVFVDETGSHIAMTPLYAYAPRGQRAIGQVPRNYGATMTLIASLSLSGMGEALILDGAADSTAFEIYVEQILAPSLSAGQIVILDNLSIHLGPKVRQAIEARGCRLLFLPTYSPDFSPIEEAFSKVKTLLRETCGLARANRSGRRWPRFWILSPRLMLSVGLLIVAIHPLFLRKRLNSYEHRSRESRYKITWISAG